MPTKIPPEAMMLWHLMQAAAQTGSGNASRRMKPWAGKLAPIIAELEALPHVVGYKSGPGPLRLARRHMREALRILEAMEPGIASDD
jgi:hypothetical protein